MILEPLPEGFSSTRESLRALACYVMSPARKARTGRISLQPAPYGFGTPPFDDRSRIAVRGDRLSRGNGYSSRLTTLRAAAAFAGVELTADPGVGHDLPPFRPDCALAVRPAASVALGSWYAFGNDVIDKLSDEATLTVEPQQIWPEHFDLATTLDVRGTKVNVGFSPGDGFSEEPYVYVGPHDLTRCTDAFWNAPFGAFLQHSDLTNRADATVEALEFIAAGVRLAT